MCRSVDLICEAVTVRQNVTVLLDYVTLNKRPYMARKKIKAIQLKNIFEAATKIQRNIKKCFHCFESETYEGVGAYVTRG